MDALNLWAKDELRSLNAQIEFILREAIRKHRTKKEFPVRRTRTTSMATVTTPSGVWGRAKWSRRLANRK